ncbi:MAG: T9SS type A sorting domain-containing protein [Flavobacteriales bacterium]|mgnify:CR=1 FL=1|nr:T9SS type A sorting domain-containing protein [Flavobacteriales bacterium]MBK7943389.1 T9SS type A sorting domain-containing protein [Flavobacteriales bacterium]MBK8948039.1 T9SS type A sorting domain-containing protein [Flavobacteriales bacterium]MBK9699921.1 T9SS type A sorting domain-containing protein [Flavobacteriales bacterium]
MDIRPSGSLLLPLLGLSLFTDTMVQAQGSFIFPDATARWQVNLWSMGATEPWRVYGMAGDTLIDGLVHKKIVWNEDTVLDGLDQVYAGALRDELGVWKFLPPGDSLALSIYDLTGTEGDTIVIEPPAFGSGPVAYQVNALDTVMLNGTMRRRWHLTALDFPWAEVWIEGIGSTEGPLTHSSFMADAGTSLVCFHEHDSLFYIDPYADDCTWTIVSIDEPADQVRFKIHPNPAQTQLHIRFDEPQATVVATIRNMQGCVIRTVQIRGDATLDVSALPRGAYLLELHAPDKHRYHTRLCLQ